jgi:hypothetical protein
MAASHASTASRALRRWCSPGTSGMSIDAMSASSSAAGGSGRALARALGARRLYDLIDGNPLFVFQPITCLAISSDDERESRGAPRSCCRRSR